MVIRDLATASVAGPLQNILASCMMLFASPVVVGLFVGVMRPAFQSLGIFVMHSLALTANFSADGWMDGWMNGCGDG